MIIGELNDIARRLIAPEKGILASAKSAAMMSASA